MSRAKITVPKKRMVWRISTAAPLGEFVDPDAAVAPPSLPTEGSEGADSSAAANPRGWTVSSFELLTGVDVSEEDSSTVPAELFDELFKPSKQ